MKASLKFREEQKPLIKAKVPLNMLGLPFHSSLAAGDSKELCLTLATFFDSGPSFRLSYRPNDAFNPFSLTIKTGIGHFGSPIDAPMTMTAEFNFLGNPNPNPSFFLHFKPQFGDFSIRKTQCSTSFRPVPSESKPSGTILGVDDEDSSLEVVEKPPAIGDGEYFYSGRDGSKGKITSLPLRSSVEGAVSGMELGAKTVLPIKNDAVLKMQWGVKFPEGFQSLFSRTARMTPRGIPLLVLNKIGIEHVARKNKSKDDEMAATKVGGPLGSAELVETCFTVKRQLEAVRGENAQLSKALEDLRVEFANNHKYKEGERKWSEVEEMNKA